MLNIGNRPTIGNGETVSVEVNLMDYEGDLYGQRLTVEFVSRLRDERRFASRNELMAQLAQDAETAKRILLYHSASTVNSAPLAKSRPFCADRAVKRR